MSTSISITILDDLRDQWEFFSDDPNLRGGDTRADSNALESNQTAAGFIFPNVAIPQGRNIISAVIKIQAHGTFDDPNVDIEANDVDDAASFASEAAIITRARTSASVQWTADAIGEDVYVSSPDISAVIQEVVDRGGWASGNDLMIMMLGRTDAPKKLTIHDPTNPGREVKLEVTFSSARLGMTVILQ